MSYSFFIARRIIFNTQPSFSRFIIRLAVAATVLSVATMVITLCLVNGFQQAVADKVYQFWGDARVQPVHPLMTSVTDDTGFTRSDSVEQAIRNTSGITGFFAYAVKSVVIKTGDQFEGILLKGVDSSAPAGGLAAFMQEGKMLSFADRDYSRGVVLSVTTAARIGVKTGDTLQCFYIRNGQDIRSRPIVVSGLYKTGIDEYDKQFGLADLRLLAKLNQWPPEQIGGYELQIEAQADKDSVAARLDVALPLQLTCLTTEEIYPNIFDWLKIQSQTKRIVIITMLIVAIINLITCLLILVMERTRMVGVLKALGMRAGSISAIFWVYASWIALVGVGSGLLLGLGLAGLQQATRFIKMDEATYYVAYAPVSINGWEIALVAVGSLLVCVLAVRLPLYYVQRISPVKAIRFA